MAAVSPKRPFSSALPAAALGAVLAFSLPAAAQDPTGILDLLQQQLQQQLTGQSSRECDENERRAQDAVADATASLGQIRSRLDRLERLDATAEARQDAVDASQRARDVVADLDALAPVYRDTADRCGSPAPETGQLVNLARSLDAEAQRADSVANRAIADAGDGADEAPVASDATRGIQEDLAALGYDVRVNGRMDDRTRNAIGRFLIDRGYDPSGRLTRNQQRRLAEEVAALGAGGGDTTRDSCRTLLTEARDADAAAVTFIGTARADVEQLERRGQAAIGSRQAIDLAATIDDRGEALDLIEQRSDAAEERCGDSLAAVQNRLEDHLGTLQALRARAEPFSRTAAAPVDPEPPLTVEERRRIQQALADLGHYRGAIDADFGRGTRSAIAAYQSEIGATPGGRLTRVQADRLIARQVATAPVEPPPAPPAPVVISPAPQPAPVVIAPTPTAPLVEPSVVADRLAEELVVWSLPPVVTPEAQGDEVAEGFAAFYQRLRGYADRGETEVVAFGRYQLAGMALLDHGPDSAEMADGLMLIAQALQASGDAVAAREYLATAEDIVSNLATGTDRRARRAAAAAQAWVGLRLAAADLMAAIDGAGGSAIDRVAADQVTAMLDDTARKITTAGDAADPGMPAELTVLRAAVAVAAGRTPRDGATRAEITRLFAG